MTVENFGIGSDGEVSLEYVAHHHIDGVTYAVSQFWHIYQQHNPMPKKMQKYNFFLISCILGFFNPLAEAIISRVENACCDQEMVLANVGLCGFVTFGGIPI